MGQDVQGHSVVVVLEIILGKFREIMCYSDLFLENFPFCEFNVKWVKQELLWPVTASTHFSVKKKNL